MNTQPNDTGTRLNATHTIRLTFSDTETDQALYAALCASSKNECRTPLTRQTKYVLRMAMGLIRPDLPLIRRFECANKEARECVSPKPIPPSTKLRLIKGGEMVKPKRN